MSAPRPGGLMVPITTPFDAAGEVETDALRDNARQYMEAGVDGILAAGSTGEASLLSDEEFRRVVACLREAVPDHRWLLAGTGRESTRGTIQACRAATDEGADAVLVRAPAYYGPTLSPDALTAHFRRVADESPLPVMIYNIPKYTHLTVPDTVLAALAGHPNIIGGKDSSGDIKNFAAYRKAAPAWALFVGHAGAFLPALELGAVGGILAAACFAWPVAMAVKDALVRGDRQAAEEAQALLGPLHRDIVGGLGVPGVKAAMDVAGLTGGPVRAPLVDVSSADRARVAEWLRSGSAGVIAGSGRAPGGR